MSEEGLVHLLGEQQAGVRRSLELLITCPNNEALPS
jgi:hypothetical protein